MTAFLREPSAWILILVVTLMFGAKRLPDVARGVGKSMRILKAETGGLPSDRPDEMTSLPPLPTTLQMSARHFVDPVTGETVLALPVPPSIGES